MKFIAIKVGKTNICRDPNESGAVLLNSVYDLGGQAIRDVKMHELLLTDLTM
jgi:hypothetical protein